MKVARLSSVWHKSRPLTKGLSRSFSTSTNTDDVSVEDLGNVKKVVLNRPKALNALSLPMIRKLTPLYQDWGSKDGVVVIMKGAGEKAFCSGGDVRAIYDAGMQQKFGRGEITSDFFYEEYNLNHKISQQKVTQVSLLNGITMGGGVGLSIHGKYRVATENTLFAMPETGIGFFPDVGGSWFLPRLPGYTGVLLGLTGARLKGQDVYDLGIATHYVQSKHLPDLEKQLSHASTSEVPLILDTFNSPNQSHRTKILDQQELVDHVYGQISFIHALRELLEMSKKDGKEQEWAYEQLEAIRRLSPLSLEVVYLQMRKGARFESIEESFKLEYDISQAMMRKGSDFYEGIRSVLVDKDRDPQWPSAQVEDEFGPHFPRLPTSEIIKFLDPLPEEEAWKPF